MAHRRVALAGLNAAVSWEGDPTQIKTMNGLFCIEPFIWFSVKSSNQK